MLVNFDVVCFGSAVIDTFVDTEFNSKTRSFSYPAGAKILPFRSNLHKISEFVFNQIDPSFSSRALEVKKEGGGVIIGGENYGQGSSREHAALAPRFLGIKIIITKSFARIHRDNLINFGIIPFMFINNNDNIKLKKNDILEIKGIKKALIEDIKEIKVLNVSQGFSFKIKNDLSKRERKILIAGGKLNHTRNLAK